MLIHLFRFFFYLFMLIGFPIIGTLVGGFFDYGNRTQGNFRNDLPSTFGFIIGLLLDFYLMLDLTVLIVTLLIISSIIAGFYTTFYVARKYPQWTHEQIRYVSISFWIALGLLIADWYVEAQIPTYIIN